MASIAEDTRSGKRSLNADINLVPFIDLLSVSICFLLMTAVWVQLGIVNIKQSRGTEAAEPTSPYDLEVRLAGNHAMDFVVQKSGKAMRTVHLASLKDLETQLTSALPVQATAITSARVFPNRGVPYGELVEVMDVLRTHQIVNLGVVPKME